MKFFLTGLSNLFKNLALIKTAVVEADRLGFDGALMTDHYMYGAGRLSTRMSEVDRNMTLETWVTLTYLAAKTEHIRLGTIVTPIPFRPPAVLAKMLSTLDVLSNGRVILGVGAGWSQEEFEGYSEWSEPKVRVDKTKEGVELMIKLWTEPEVTFEGRYYQAKGAVLEPKPLQKPYPPLLFGGRGTRMLKLAGKYADICYLSSPDPNEPDIQKSKETVLLAAEKAKHVNRIAFAAGRIGSGQARFGLKDYCRNIESASKSGATYFLASFPANENFMGSMRIFASEVMPSFN